MLKLRQGRNRSEKMDFEKIENEYYKARYCSFSKDMVLELWDKIKNNKKILKWAITKTRDKFDEKDTVNGISICESIVINYNDVDEDVYSELINLIYSNRDIARIVLDGASNGGYSYLLMALCNYDYKLSEDMKTFAVLEAMNKIGTVRYKEGMDEYLKMLDEKGINDEQISMINIDGSLNHIGLKTKYEYAKHTFDMLSDSQAHGRGEFDIRYHILRNANWTLEEKQKLVYDFWADSDEFDDNLEVWKWNVINDVFRYDSLGEFDADFLYVNTYESYFYLIRDKEITDRIWDEINFCKLMEELRPVKDDDNVKKKRRVVKW